MKRKTLMDRFCSMLCAMLFATVLSFAGVACIITAFELHQMPTDHRHYLPCDLNQLFLWAVVISFLISLCYSFRLGPLIPILFTAWILYQWFYGNLAQSLEGFAYVLSRRYNRAYQCGVIFWSEKLPLRTDLMPILRALVTLVSMSVCWTVCRKQNAFWVLAISLLCLIPCTIITSTVPDAKILFLWLATLALFLITQWSRLQSSRQGLVLTLITLLPTALICALLFFFLPRDSYQGKEHADALLSRFEDLFQVSGSTPGVGMSTEDRVDLSRVGTKSNRKTPIMYLTAPETGTYYLRGKVYTDYTGTQWISEDHATLLPWRNGQRTGDSLKIRTRFENNVLYMPYSADPALLTAYDLGWENSELLKEYSYSCYTPAGGPYTSFDYNDLTMWTGLPTSTHRWATSVLESIDDYYIGENYNTELAILISDYVRSSAKYSLQTPRMDEQYTDFAQWFLEESDTGYCVHFATAATVLLRAAGVPARYVTGYMVDAQKGQETTVYQKDAHAWVEYWTYADGWQVLEATPAQEDTPEPTRPSMTVAPTTKPTLPTESTTETEEPETTTTEEPTAPSTSQDDSPAGSGTGDAGIGVILKAILLPVLLVGIIIGQWRLRLCLSRNARKKGNRNQRALTAWRQSRRYARALNKNPDSALRKLAEKARFSPHELTQQELLAFERYITDSVQSLKTQAWYRRIVHRLILALY